MLNQIHQFSVNFYFYKEFLFQHFIKNIESTESTGEVKIGFYNGEFINSVGDPIKLETIDDEMCDDDFTCQLSNLESSWCNPNVRIYKISDSLESLEWEFNSIFII